MTTTRLISITTQARRERQRLAAEDGAKALAEYERRAVEIRKNMARLRELRLANEAAQPVETQKPRKTQTQKKAATSR
jgi:hypothetical protein